MEGKVEGLESPGHLLTCLHSSALPGTTLSGGTGSEGRNFRLKATLYSWAGLSAAGQEGHYSTAWAPAKRAHCRKRQLLKEGGGAKSLSAGRKTLKALILPDLPARLPPPREATGALSFTAEPGRMSDHAPHLLLHLFAAPPASAL